jgi:hypothetical protein
VEDSAVTEAEWVTSADAVALVRWLVPTASKRKLQLYLCGGCRCIQPLFFHPYSVRAIEVAERFADGLADRQEFSDACYLAEVPTFGCEFDEDILQRNPERARNVLPRLVELGALSKSVLSGGRWEVNETVRERLLVAARTAYYCGWNIIRDPEWQSQDIHKVGWPGRWLIDCVFGNPFRPIAFDPAWRTHTAVAIAQLIYDDRDFGLLPVLADALEDAGSEDADLLNHCRLPGQHARGCWAVDMVLGRT